MVGSGNKEAVPSFLQSTARRVGLTKADAAYAEIRERILACDLAPGAVVDQEAFANWLGSSTTPIREALRRLEAEQLVVLRAHSEVRVAPASIEEFREFHTIRMGLEPLAAEEATESASEELIANLRSLMAAPDAKGDEAEVDLRSSRMFHRVIYTASGNRTLTQILDNIWDRVGRYRVMLSRVGRVASCDSPEHQAIVAAMEARDAKRVGDLIREDLEITFQHILPSLGAGLEAALADS